MKTKESAGYRPCLLYRVSMVTGYDLIDVFHTIYTYIFVTCNPKNANHRDCALLGQGFCGVPA